MGKSRQIPLQFSTLLTDTISLQDLKITLWHGRKSIIDDFLCRYHYLGPIQVWKFCFVALYETEIVAVATLGRPTARLEDQQSTLELTRFCLAPQVNQVRNAGSFILSKILKLLKKTHYKRIISYADLSRHRGTIYLASNFKLVKRYQKKGNGWLNRPGRHCIYGNTPKAKFEYLL